MAHKKQSIKEPKMAKKYSHFPRAVHVEGSEDIQIAVRNLYMDPVCVSERAEVDFFVKRLKKQDISYRLVEFFKSHGERGQKLAIFVSERELRDKMYGKEKAIRNR